VHFGQGTHGNSYAAHGNDVRTREEGSDIFIEALRRQLECRARHKLIRGVHQAHDEGTLSLEEGARRAWAPSFVRVYTIRGKQVCRRTVISFSSGGLAVRQTLRRSVVDGMMAPLYSFPLRPL
jgi:hypothetical protein